MYLDVFLYIVFKYIVCLNYLHLNSYYSYSNVFWFEREYKMVKVDRKNK